MAEYDESRGVVLIRTVNGCQIHYEIRQNSNSDGTPVLFLHGWGCDLRIFFSVMDAVQDRATLIAMDFPAHGESEEPPEPWGVGEFAQQVKQLLIDLQIMKVHIIAHSFGARVAIWLAAHDPNLIDKLVITGGAGIKKPATPEANKRTARYKRLSAAVRFLENVPLLKRPMKKMQNLLILKYGSIDYARLSESMRSSFVRIVSEDLTPLLSQIASPTLLIWGGADRETPLWMGETMEREIKDAGLVVFDGRSHYAFLEDRVRFLLVVKQFFWGGEQG